MRVSEPRLPTIASPVAIPMPISISGSPRSRLRALTSLMASCMASAAATARSVSSSAATGAPKKARMPSPRNSPIVPRCSDSITRTMVPRWLLRMDTTSVGGSDSVRDEKPRRSAFRIETWRFSPRISSPSTLSSTLSATSSET